MTPERLQEIVSRLVQPGFRLVYDAESGGEVQGPGLSLTQNEIDTLNQRGWLRGMPSGGGAWLSDAGRAAYLRSADELGFRFLFSLCCH